MELQSVFVYIAKLKNAIVLIWELLILYIELKTKSSETGRRE